jgi:predicted esterase
MKRLMASIIATVLALAAVPATGATKTGTSSFYTGPGPKPGPAILYRRPAKAAQLTNAKPWRAAPILVSGANAYRDGEFLYQDFLYDDHGARDTTDPNDPQNGSEGDLFSMPNGTYTYPTGPGYDGNAADLVEFRVKALAEATAFRVTLNTLTNPKLIAFSIAIGGVRGHTFAFPDGANVKAPAKLFLTVHPRGNKLVADLVNAANGRRVKGPSPKVKVDRRRRQISVDIAHRAWNPRRHTVRFAMGVGLWNASAHKYLLPGASATATTPGGAGAVAHPAAFFNVAFRVREPFPSVEASTSALTNAAWWRDRAQGHALAAGNISSQFAYVSFAKLARKVTDNSGVPRTGPIDRIVGSHFEPAQGVDFSKQCGFGGASNPSSCVPEYRGRLEPYAIYVPRKRPAAGYGMTLLLHSLSANYNQYSTTRNQSQFANRTIPSIVITPEARGPDQEYEGLGSADTFEVWNDVAHRYHLNPNYTEITGYSMGGIGTFKLGAQFPDLFARAQPTVGAEEVNAVIPSLRNLPVLMWNNSADELVNPALYQPTAMKLSSLGYRYELDVFQPCANPKCSPLFPNHLELAINDQFAPAAKFLGKAMVNRNPAHVTYVVDPARSRPQYGVVGDHAYWVSGLKLRSASGNTGQIDALSHGFGVGDAKPSAQKAGVGTLTGGHLGTLTFTRTSKTWGSVPKAKRSDAITIVASNIAKMSIAVGRAKVNCHVKLKITTDGPIAVSLPACHRTVHAT